MTLLRCNNFILLSKITLYKQPYNFHQRTISGNIYLRKERQTKKQGKIKKEKKIKVNIAKSQRRIK